MILPNPKDAVHKAWLYRILTKFCDDQNISSSLYFKGGTFAAMQGLLDRFSIDLDFDYVGNKIDLPKIRKGMENIFRELGLEIKDKSKHVPQYFLKYTAKNKDERCTIKIDVTMPPPRSNKYEPVRLNEIDRILFGQTIETMFANKIVAAIERYEKNRSIAGRDIYDIHHFFLSGYSYNAEVIKERRKTKDIKAFFNQLITFIENNVTGQVISQDLNMLLPYDKFKRIKTTLKQETLMFLKDELARIG